MERIQTGEGQYFFSALLFFFLSLNEAEGKLYHRHWSLSNANSMYKERTGHSVWTHNFISALKRAFVEFWIINYHFHIHIVAVNLIQYNFIYPCEDNSNGGRPKPKACIINSLKPLFWNRITWHELLICWGDGWPEESVSTVSETELESVLHNTPKKAFTRHQI